MFSEFFAGFRISIHALREEGDMYAKRNTERGSKFLSTPSARRATFVASSLCVISRISIHALREEGDLYSVPGLYKL